MLSKTVFRLFFRVAFAFTVAAVAGACSDRPLGPICTAEAVFGIQVDVLDGSGAPAAQGATGVAVEDAFADTLMIFDAVRMAGVVERPGTYEVTVSKPGFVTWSARNITVTADECHVIPVTLQANLIASP